MEELIGVGEVGDRLPFLFLPNVKLFQRQEQHILKQIEAAQQNDYFFGRNLVKKEMRKLVFLAFLSPQIKDSLFLVVHNAIGAPKEMHIDFLLRM